MVQYNADNLVVLEGLNAVRLRPGMYIGTTGAKGLHHILWEIVDNSMDEASNGYADKIDIIIHSNNSISVQDNGRGIPVDINKKHNKSGVEIVFTQLHAGGKFDNEEYKFSGGLHGVGASVTNALSEWLTVEVIRDKKLYRQEFHSPRIDGKVMSGIVKSQLKEVGSAKGRGTKVTFLPDVEVFGKELFELATIKTRLRELAFLNKGITLTLVDERVVSEEGEFKNYSFCYNGGIADYVSFLNEAKSKRSNKIIYLVGALDNFEFELAMQYTDNPTESLFSYVNNIPTAEGGTHETGFKSSMTRCFNDYARKRNLLKAKDENLQGDDFRDGMTAVLSIKMQNVQFEGQTKTKLGNPEVKSIIEALLNEKLDAYLSDTKNKDVGDLIVKVGIAKSQEREAVRRAKELSRQKNASSAGSVLVGKFAACSGRNADINELFIVEGDSAGGSAKQGRDRSFQAILPLKGKPINAEKKRINELMANDEIKTIIFALGTDCGNDFNIKNLKYSKVIILADADQDGAHIRAILLTFFFRYMKELILEGNVYIGMPPLYKVEKKGVVTYVYDDVDLDTLIAELKSGYTIQRYKGLGEMNPEQLWDTTLDPRKRTLMRVTIDDAAEADLMVTTLMGDNIEARRNFINENANFNKVDLFAEKYS